MAPTPKEILFEEEARDKLRQGVDMVADVVGVTLGPKGRNISMQASWGPPTVTNDGNTIVKDISVRDQFINMGISMSQEVAAKMQAVCGDGVTTSLLLLAAIVDKGMQYVTSGASPVELNRGMRRALDAVLEEIGARSIPVESDEARRNIATVAASGLAEVGEIISEAFRKSGKDGVVTIEEGKSTTTVVTTVEGMQFERGYVSPYFSTDAETLRCEFENVKILITDKKISSIQEILSVLQIVASSGQALLIIAEDVDGDALSTLVVNKLRGSLKVCAVKAPGFGDKRKALLQDLAILTGATLISTETGRHLKDAGADELGYAARITVAGDKTTIVGGGGSIAEIKVRVQQIEQELKETTSDYDKEKLEERRAKLRGGVTVVSVGGTTEVAMKQQKQIFEDSMNATRAALDEGIVVGGGVALLRARAVLQELKKELKGDEIHGAQIIYLACEVPILQIIKNTGMEPRVILQEVELHGEYGFGFNALSEKTENLFPHIVDPTRVVREALRRAASVAGIILLSECLIGDAPEETDVENE
jgi:chaperonin GroEL